MSATIQRTASWELLSSVRSKSGNVRSEERTANTATETASAMNAIRISPLCTVPWLERMSVSSRIGPNSPTAPAASRYVPKRVRSSPVSDRIGMSMPIAVVARADPV
jgi:hypothetical protein